MEFYGCLLRIYQYCSWGLRKPRPHKAHCPFRRFDPPVSVGTRWCIAMIFFQVPEAGLCAAWTKPEMAVFSNRINRFSGLPKKMVSKGHSLKC